jgi:hypothetical protein
MMGTKQSLLEILCYLWVGYGTYLAIPLSALSTLVAIYYLAIDSIPAFKSVFSHFWLFLIAAVALGIPLAYAVGWLHIKHSPAAQSAKTLKLEANKHKVEHVPEYLQDTVAPLYVELLKGVEKILDRNDLLNDEDKTRIRELETKLQALINSGKD